jgi:hypothetical protein
VQVSSSSALDFVQLLHLPLMERRDLIRQLRDGANEAGLEFASLRNTGGHEVFSLNGPRIPIPDHREIA